MKRLVTCLLLVLCLLCSCGGKDGYKVPDFSTAPVTEAVNSFNAEPKRAIKFLLNVKKDGENESSFFSQGNAAYQREKPVAMSGRMTQIYKGKGTTADVYYKAGAYYRSSTDSKYYVIMDKELLLEQFICTNVPLFDENKLYSAKTAQTGAGTKYSFSVEADTAVLSALFDETLYSACGLRKPQRDKTLYKNPVYTYVVDKDGALVSFTVSVSAHLYETPAYYPNYKVPESELFRAFEISYELNVSALGDEVVIDSPVTKDYIFLS